MEANFVSTEKWMDKENVVCIYNGIVNHKKEGNIVIYNNMDGLWGNYAMSNKSDRERQILCDLIYMWDLKRIGTHRYREQIGGCQRQAVGNGWNRWRWVTKPNLGLLAWYAAKPISWPCTKESMAFIVGHPTREWETSLRSIPTWSLS